MGWKPMHHASYSSVHPAALLVLLPAAAGTWIVAADLHRFADDLLDLGRPFALHFAGGRREDFLGTPTSAVSSRFSDTP